jgi:hypothetical protein
MSMIIFSCPHHKWRWTPWDYAALSATIQRALEHHSEAVADMAPLREYVRHPPPTFLEQVRGGMARSVDNKEADPLPVSVCSLPLPAA